MKSPTKKFTVTVSQAEVELKDWITGEDSEYIDEAMLDGIKMTPDARGKSVDFKEIDVAALAVEGRREIEKFVVSVGGETKDVLKLVLGLPEDDYFEVRAEIAKRRKKKLAFANGPSQQS